MKDQVRPIFFHSIWPFFADLIDIYFIVAKFQLFSTGKWNIHKLINLERLKEKRQDKFLSTLVRRTTQKSDTKGTKISRVDFWIFFHLSSHIIKSKFKFTR